MAEEKSATEKLLEENRIINSRTSVEMEDFFNTTEAQYDEFDEASRKKGKGYVCPNFPLFDKHMEGLESGFYLFAGESNGGKSAILTNLMFDYCTHEDNNLFGIYFALDDTKNVLIPRLIAMHEHIPISVASKPVRYEELIDEGAEGSSTYAEQLEKRKHGLEYLKSLNRHFKIEDAIKITCGEQIVDYLKKLKTYLATEAPDMKIICAIDSVSDIQFEDPNFQRMSDKQKGDYIAINVKDWSVQLDIPIFGSIHLKKIEQNRRPTVSDIRDSGRYIYEADWIGLVHNDVSKNKQGATIYVSDMNTGEKLPVIELNWAKNKKSSYKGMTYHTFVPNFSLVQECNEEISERFNSLLYTF